jgi:beta-mannosidase
MEIGASPSADVPPVPAQVPGSVQKALLDAGVLPDWNVGDNARRCEWVENRHWILETLVSAVEERAAHTELVFHGLDGRGWIRLDGEEIAEFDNAHLSLRVEVGQRLREPGEHLLQVVFAEPPRWLGQFGYSSQMEDWKPRFNYGWDWTSRLVQIGVWDRVELELYEERIRSVRWWAADDGQFEAVVEATGGASVQVELQRLGRFSAEVADGSARVSGVCQGAETWHPNGNGEPRLYWAKVRLLDANGSELDLQETRVGFRTVEWVPLEDQPSEALPWRCRISGQDTFLQGVNWTPIRPNFADVPDEEYRKRLETYRDLGFNVLRLWGGATRERDVFYQLCDEFGILVWHDLPLSSSGLENLPPGDEESVEALRAIFGEWIDQLQHHPSLLLWCGGNELMDENWVPVTREHSAIKALASVAEDRDPGRRFVTASASGPTFCSDPERVDEGRHWDVHGPWKLEGTMEEWERFFAKDDALIRSELGAPGPSPVDLIQEFAGELNLFPPSPKNPYWRRTGWWLENEAFEREHGHKPRTLEEYVAWGQERQAKALKIAARSCKERWPKCGGVIIWMGHDSFPCTANTSLLDFYGRPKPAAYSVSSALRSLQG